jgi:drug/metabolite transporter (DMT)-like permease
VRKETLPTDRNAIIVFLTLGILSFSLPFILVYWGELHVSSGLASILFAVYPFIVALFSHFFLKGEHLTFVKFVGILLGFAGILMIFWQDITWGGADMPAMLAILLSTVLQAISLIIMKKRAKQIPPVALSVGGLIPGLVVMYGLALLLDDFSLLRFDAKGIGSILYLGTFGTVVTFVTYYWLLKHIEAVYMSLVALVTPIVAVILGALVLDEVLSPHAFGGASLVLAGILIANSRDLLLTLRNRRAGD